MSWHGVAHSVAAAIAYTTLAVAAIVWAVRRARRRLMVSDAPTPEALAAFAAYRELERELLQSGESVSGEGLGHPVVSTTVRRGEKGVVATDGPFVELKEVLASFAVIDAAGHERAVEIRPRTRSRRLFRRATGVGRSMGFPRIRGVGRSGSVIAG